MKTTRPLPEVDQPYGNPLSADFHGEMCERGMRTCPKTGLVE